MVSSIVCHRLIKNTIKYLIIYSALLKHYLIIIHYITNNKQNKIV